MECLNLICLYDNIYFYSVCPGFGVMSYLCQTDNLCILSPNDCVFIVRLFLIVLCILSV